MVRKRVVVVGGAGFVGSHVVRALQRSFGDDAVLVLDRSANEHASETQAIRCDIACDSKKSLTAILDRAEAEAIVHCAGATVGSDEELLRENLGGTIQLLEACADSRRTKHFCYIGSSAEYDAVGRPGRTPESTPIHPTGPYARSKAAASQVVLEARGGALCPYVVRLFNPIGTGMSSSTLLGRLWSLVVNRDAADVTLGDLGGFRDYLDIGDASRAIALSVNAGLSLKGRAINVGSGEAHCSRDLVSRFLAASGLQYKWVETGVGSRRSASVSWQEADVALAVSVLGWVPSIPFAAAVEALGRIAKSERTRQLRVVQNRT